MSARTFAIGDIHGDLDHLDRLMRQLPRLTPSDTLVFLGDYLDRGPDSAGVIRALMALPEHTPAKVVCLRGNHEDGWLRVLDGSWPQFVLPAANGCLQAMESFLGRPISGPDSPLKAEDFDLMLSGKFFPDEVIAWMRALPWWYEDELAIYVHAGLVSDQDGQFQHPSQVSASQRKEMLWTRTASFFREYRGKLVVVGHTSTRHLPPELSTFTPEDPDDLWAGPAVVGLDTRCGKGGFLTAMELPAMRVYETR